MSTPPPDSSPLPDDDRDLRLARRLDAGAPPDGADPLHDRLRALRPEAASVDAGASARLWRRVEAGMGDDLPASAPDRAPLRLVRTPMRRWAVAASVLVALGLVWFAQRGPEVAAFAEAEIVTFPAPDGSTITLRPNSRLYRLDERAYRLEGEALFAVAPDAGRPFTVEAGVGSVRVLGTRFDVSTWGRATEVFVEEGRVRVEAGGEAVELGAGEAAEARLGGVLPLPNARAETYLDWQRGEAVFEQATVGQVADEIAHHFGVSILMTDEIARRSVSGVIALESTDDALDQLGRILGGRFEWRDESYVFVGR